MIQLKVRQKGDCFAGIARGGRDALRCQSARTVDAMLTSNSAIIARFPRGRNEVFWRKTRITVVMGPRGSVEIFHELSIICDG